MCYLREVGMSVLCIFKVINNFSQIKRVRELLILVQFIGLTYVWTLTSFYNQYPLLVMFSMSILFYLINGKMVLAFITKKQIKLFHLELLYLLIPTGILLAKNYGYITTEKCDDLQIKAGFLVLALHVERMITYSVKVINRVSNYLGIKFFEIPRKKIN